MNLIGEDEFKEQEKKNNKLSVIIIVSISVIIAICIAIVCTIYYIQSQQFVFTIDGQVQNSYAEDLFIFEDGKVYISIQDLAKVPSMGYNHYNGEYNQYEENKDACYVQDSYGFESCTYVKDSNTIYKNMQYKTTEYEYFEIDEPVKQINNKLYTTIDGAKLGFNSEIVYSEEKNRIDIYSVYYLAKSIYGEETVSKLSESNYEDFNNFKAILHGMKVVTEGTSSNSNVGVNSLSNQVIIGARYKEIEFMEATNEFKVVTNDNKVGIVDAEGTTKIRPDYDSIINIDKDLKLYMVSIGNKYGIVTDTNRTVIHTEYDSIGIDASVFRSNDIKNSYIIYDKCIPVQKDKKWGIFDVNGNNILPVTYDELGCTSSGVKDKTTNPLLIIPRVEGIVVGLNKKYGVYSSEGKELFPIVLDSIYSTVSSGIDTYFMMYDGIEYGALEMINRYVTRNEQNNTVNTNIQNNSVNDINNEEQTIEGQINEEEIMETEMVPTDVQ